MPVQLDYLFGSLRITYEDTVKRICKLEGVNSIKDIAVPEIKENKKQSQNRTRKNQKK